LSSHHCRRAAKNDLERTHRTPSFHPRAFEARRFANLCGQFDEHLRLIEQRLAIEIRNRGNQFELIGEPKTTSAAEQLLRRLYRETKATELSPETVHLYLQESAVENMEQPGRRSQRGLRTKGMIRPRGSISSAT
jgi:phosphate starvation-inducible PhoH-like protein